VRQLLVLLWNNISEKWRGKEMIKVRQKREGRWGKRTHVMFQLSVLERLNHRITDYLYIGTRLSSLDLQHQMDLNKRKILKNAARRI
jgi:hypothetical protein